ncbi:uncharacterized protein N7506_008467 [Penicillium brevicompactum]|uniref:uncharacterized protein n=1 Tax=Penicillium brevicompactum TaxID=5074 RepID=UPI0025411BB8|nr:uncharacterized protein N7506_008467 [Penicillium brevicompactum]KAJ5325365.1 hypothetical protein N7506_008467 [Penicillium brevicompactum]
MSKPQSHDFAYLPSDIFWMILGYLGTTDIVRSRRVSRAWNAALSNPAMLAPILKREFPWTTEAKQLSKSSDSQCHASALEMFDQVASRYFHLEQAKPRSIQKYQLCDAFGSTKEHEWYQVKPWDTHSSHNMGVIGKICSEALWTVEDRLVVYPSAQHRCLVLMDLETDRQFMVPFIISGKAVRRVRLAKRLLVVEWAESKAFHWLNESDGVHRHFASSFDISQGANDGWNIIPRNEWKIMFLGHPLSERDRFFSSHNNTHYVIYTWQPNRSLYTADDDAPIESMFVWDISSQSSYRPSSDPSGRLRDDAPDGSPHIVSRFSFRDLEFFGIRQRGCPSMQRLRVTDDSQEIEITESRVPSSGYSETMLLPELISTSIPVNGHGPHWRRKFPGVLPPYRGNCGLNAEPIKCDGMTIDQWFPITYHITDNGAVDFRLTFDFTGYHGTDNLTIKTPRSTFTDGKSMDFINRGKVAGCERYIVGENRNRQLVIYHFDR